MEAAAQQAADLRKELSQLAAERADVDNRLSRLQAPGRGRGRGPAVASRAPFQPQRSQLLSAVVSQQREADATLPGDDAAAAEGANDVKLKRPVREASSRCTTLCCLAACVFSLLCAPLAPRRRQEESNPAQQKRARRILGSLLGTLHKFRQEEGAVVRQELVAKRATILQRAEDKEKEESRRLRDLERSTMDDRCREEKQLRMRLDTAMQEKRLRLAHVTWVANQERAFTFLQTAALPALLYLPARMNKEAQEALDVRLGKLASFRNVELPAAALVVEDRIRALHAARGASPQAMEAGEPAGEEEEEGQVPSAVRQRKAPAAQAEIEVDEEDEAANPETLQDLLA